MENPQTFHPLVAAQKVGEKPEEPQPKMSPDGKMMRVQILSGEGVARKITAADGRNYVINGKGQLINTDRKFRGKKEAKLYKRFRRITRERSRVQVRHDEVVTEASGETPSSEA